MSFFLKQLSKVFTQASILLACLFLAACQPNGGLAPLASSATVLAFGDSLTYGTGVSAENSYPEVLDGLIDQKVVRSGVPGEVSRAGLVRLKATLEKHQPDLVILCHGGNDVLRRMSAAETKKNLTEMVKLARTAGADVVLIAVPNLSLFPTAAGYYEELENELDVPVEYEILASLQRDKSKKSDAVHFNARGYSELADAVAELLREEGAI